MIAKLRTHYHIIQHSNTPSFQYSIFPFPLLFGLILIFTKNKANTRMPQAKKFGAFAGVFTPSILTILGVIMYLRLGWVVGEAGLIGAVLIILLAHVISVSTGLSISSIATDKKIKTGGIYYMLSRSLGLPMGGSIGITIFVGTALSIALYLVGFAENFLSIEPIREFLNLGTSQNDIRIVGTGAIVLLVILAFISTSLAIRSQFIILGAIALSLVSIAFGFLTNIQFQPDAPLFSATPEALPFETIFAIFFPAVTGFTAGVAMSGDLKDSKKSSPKGTLWAIVVGLVVYLGLAISLGFFVNRELLLKDYNFLMKIAFWSPLVIAGIWGATLSSALGGILGAPRILQAISKDRILPKIFGVGYGANNEPRNALLFTFVIAEAGILIGELDVIARVVSMFYIAAYGFINLAYALENWASSDFRPSFKVSKWIGIIGFFACFAVMFKLDAMAMALAIIVMFGIYFLLTKKELSLDFGDVWQSVWSNIVRSSLNRVVKKGLETRNWKPNIILFSGGTKQRPYLIDLGKHIVGKQGFLSNFDLIEKTDNTVLPRHKQALEGGEEFVDSGIFSRRHVCEDVYEGIKTIAGTYGFSGIEPNTIMLGWARQSEKPVRFINTINYLKALDMNVVLMDYDKRVGFGKYSQIDIWWRTTEHNGNLALMLLKFLWLSNEWRNAKARILIVNPVNEQRETIQRNTRSILDNMRISAEVKVINNQIEKRSFYDIVQVESVNSDLIFLGLPEIEQGSEEQFVKETNKLCGDIGTVILIKASTNFKSLHIGIKHTLLGQIEKLDNAVIKKDPVLTDLVEINYPSKPEIAGKLKLLHADLMQINGYYQANYLSKLFGYQDNLISLIKEAISKSFGNIREKVCEQGRDEQHKNLVKFESNLLFRIRKIVEDFEKEIFDIQHDKLKESVDYYFAEIDKVIYNCPKHIKVEVDKDELKNLDGRGFDRLWFSTTLKIRGFLSKGRMSYRLKYHDIVLHFLQVASNKLKYDILDKWGIASLQNVIRGNQFVSDLGLILFQLEKKASVNELDVDFLQKKQIEVDQKLAELSNLNHSTTGTIENTLVATSNDILQKLSAELKNVNANEALKKYYYDGVSRKNIRQLIKSIPASWQRNQTLLFNSVLLEISLLSFNTKLRLIFKNLTDEFSHVFDVNVIDQQKKLETFLVGQLTDVEKSKSYKFNPEGFNTYENRELIQAYFNQLIENTFRRIRLASSSLPETAELVDESSMSEFYSRQYKSIGSVNISVSKLMDYLLQSEFVEPLQESLANLPQKIEKATMINAETLRLLSFAFDLEREKAGTTGVSKEKTIGIIEQQVTSLRSELTNSEELKIQILRIFQERLNSFEDKLFYHSFIKAANNLKQYIREIESRKRWFMIRSKQEKIGNYLQHLLNQFWYRQSKGIMLTQKLKAKTLTDEFQVNKSLNFLEGISIKSDVMEKLPFYYRQLFLRKQYFLNEFWVGRENELSEANKALRRFNAGIKGGILITGDHNSGKTFFSQYFINQFYRDANVYNLSAPYGGSADVNVFKEAIENALEIKGSYYRIFNSLPEKSVLIIDDLALWWEKSQQGMQVVLQLIDLIDKYGHRCLFIVNVNRFCLDVLKKTNDINNHFLNVINLEPLNSEDLQKLVLLRHKSSILSVRLARRVSETVRSWDYARVFARHFTYSKGIVGVALQAWLANIIDVDGNKIYIQSPRTLDLFIFDYLKPEWYILIVQLVLHKRANLRKLSRICQTNVGDTKNNVEILKRSGIISESNPGVYEINTFMYPHILAKLLEKDVL
jgi:amino acid transporter